MKVTNVEITDHQKHTGVAVLRAQGDLGPENYLKLVERSQAVYNSGQRNFILDIHEVTRVGISGLFALLSVATIFSGENAPDPRGGWRGLRQIAEKLINLIPQGFEIVADQAEVENVARQIGLPVYHDLGTALAAIE